jgi:hypothetical protein
MRNRLYLVLGVLLVAAVGGQVRVGGRRRYFQTWKRDENTGR